MVSIAGLKESVVKELCEAAKKDPDDVCQISNVLFPNGFSCGGTAAAVERLRETALGTEGCLQSKMLKVGGGFHTKLMQSAKEKLQVALQEALPNMKSPRCDVYMNVTGRKIPPATQPSEIVNMLGDQLVSPVQWEPICHAMIDDKITEFYECGPMKQLKAMMKRIDFSAFEKTTNIDV